MTQYVVGGVRKLPPRPRPELLRPSAVVLLSSLTHAAESRGRGGRSGR